MAEGLQIAVLAADALRDAYNWTSGQQGNVEAVAYASFSHPSAGVIDAYAKFYHPESRGMVNEITGWLLGKACGLPVPSVAFVALVPLDRLPKPLEGIAMLAEQTGHTTFPAFCTQDSNPYGVPPIADTQSLIDEIKGGAIFIAVSHLTNMQPTLIDTVATLCEED